MGLPQYDHVDISFVVDTNILIQFEEPGPDGRIREQFQRLHALLIENQIYFQYHPASVEDLEKMLDIALNNEDYMKAAQIRDEIDKRK